MRLKIHCITLQHDGRTVAWQSHIHMRLFILLFTYQEKLCVIWTSAELMCFSLKCAAENDISLTTAEFLLRDSV